MTPGSAPRRGGLPQVYDGFDHDRFVENAKAIWARLPRNGGLPRVETLKAELLPLYRAHSVLLSFSNDQLRSRIVYLGHYVAEMAGIEDRGTVHDLSDFDGASVLGELARQCEQVRSDSQPLELEKITASGPEGELVFRGILLPFCDRHGSNVHIFAVLDGEDRAAPDTGVFDLTSEHLAHDPVAILDLELGQMAAAAEARAVPPAGSLSDALERARALADHALAYDKRSRKALYAAIAKAYDFGLLALGDPDRLAAIAQEAGITMQARAPMTPVVKLVFGSAFDRTRVTEYATVLAHAAHCGVEEGGLSAFIETAEGGIKGIVAEARALRRAGKREPGQRKLAAATVRKLRDLPTRPLTEAHLGSAEFGLVLVRQDRSGKVIMVGEVCENPSLIEKLSREQELARRYEIISTNNGRGNGGRGKD